MWTGPNYAVFLDFMARPSFASLNSLTKLLRQAQPPLPRRSHNSQLLDENAEHSEWRDAHDGEAAAHSISANQRRGLYTPNGIWT